MQQSGIDILLRMADEILHSILQRQFIESSKQDFAVIGEFANVYKYQLLLVQPRRKLRVPSGESSH
jgi:hypothetical protein